MQRQQERAQVADLPETGAGHAILVLATEDAFQALLFCSAKREKEEVRERGDQR